MENIPQPIKKRIRALRYLQLANTNLEAKFHQSVYELERDFMEKHSTFFEKRDSIIK